MVDQRPVTPAPETGCNFCARTRERVLAEFERVKHRFLRKDGVDHEGWQLHLMKFLAGDDK